MQPPITVKMTFTIQKNTLKMEGSAGPAVSSGSEFGYIGPLPPIHRATVEEEIQVQRGRQLEWFRTFYGGRAIRAEVTIIDERQAQTDLGRWGVA